LSTRLNPPPEEVTIRLDPAQETVETPALQVTQRSHTRSAQSLYRLLGIGFAFTDALCISAALLLSHQIRWGTWFSNDYLIAQSLSVILWVVVFRSMGLHSPERISPPEEFRRVFSAASVGLMLLVMTTFWSHSGFSRVWVALTYVLSVFFELAVRQVWRKYLYRLRVSGALAFRTIIVGTNDEAGHLARSLAQKGSGFTPLGYVSPTDRLASPFGLPVLGHLDDLRDTIQTHEADCVFVASSGVDAADMLSVSQAARQEQASVRVSANLPEVLASRISVQPIGTTMAIALKPVHLTRTQSILKRAFDIIVSSILLVVTLPFSLVIAAAIRLDSPGSVLFCQRRVTRGGHVFLMYKFRTMHDGVAPPPEDSDTSVPFFKPQDDPRVTRVGRFLRRTSLDELPQLWHVVKGQLSLVGPRPLPAEQVAANLSLLGPRHEVQAGVTGWWQINGRSELSAQEALHLDLFYIENWSLAFDLYILMKTLGVIIARRGAY
jgi:exopolysaccharide biosynthesis polyprenyl glycosylphosphotransferase